MQERDRLMKAKVQGQNDRDMILYVITPTPMMKWMTNFKEQNITVRPDLIELVPSCDLNPEKNYYYQKASDYSKTRKGNTETLEYEEEKD
jgi:hypothetical protein